jgi:hypothetical protein
MNRPLFAFDRQFRLSREGNFHRGSASLAGERYSEKPQLAMNREWGAAA